MSLLDEVLVPHPSDPTDQKVKLMPVLIVEATSPVTKRRDCLVSTVTLTNLLATIEQHG